MDPVTLPLPIPLPSKQRVWKSQVNIGLKDFKKLEKSLISKRILFKTIAVVHGKGECPEIKGNICNIPIEAANICHISPRLAISLTYLKSCNKFYEDILKARSFFYMKILQFSGWQLN